MLGSSERERVIWVRTNERSLSKGSARLRVAKTIETGAAPDRRLPGECDRASLSRAFLKAAGMRGSKALEMVERRDSLITRPTILRIRDTGNGLEIITGKSINRRRSSPRRCPMPHCPPRGRGGHWNALLKIVVVLGGVLPGDRRLPRGLLGIAAAGLRRARRRVFSSS